jgi:putative Holliday junction resolvase
VRAAAIDFGGRRIGLAVSDASRTLARPFDTLTRPHGSSDRQAVDAVLEAVDRFERDAEPVDTLVVGVPHRLDGSPNEHTSRVERFIMALRAATPRRVVVQDERLTSHEADERLALGERDWKKRKARLDAAAAAVILQEFLDTQPRPAPEPSSEPCAD